MTEIWKDIQGYEGVYQVSNMGNVKSLKRTWFSGRGLCSKKTKAECFITQAIRNGYLSCVLTKNGIQKQHSVHRLVAAVFIPNELNKPQINHKNGVKTDNCVENLEWSTPSENSKHAYDSGLSRGRKMGEHSRAIPVKCETFGMDFSCILEASKILGVFAPNISLVCSGKRKEANGLTFRYI